MSITSGFKKFKNHIKNGDGTYSLQSLWTSAQTVECADGTTVEDKIGGLKGISTDLETTEAGYAADMTVVSQLNTDIEECFQSVSDGKSLIAAAITGKGITTAVNAAFATMAGNIANIRTEPSAMSIVNVENQANGVSATYKTPSAGWYMTCRTTTSAGLNDTSIKKYTSGATITVTTSSGVRGHIFRITIS